MASDTMRRPFQRVAGDCATAPAEAVPTAVVPAPAAHTRAGVVIEVVYLRADMDGRWHYRRGAQDLPARTEPDRAARSLAGLDDTAAAPTSVLHSTSWRYDPAGHVILTYAVLPDPDPSAAANPLPSMEIARGEHHAHPTPAALGPDHVAAHAIRHLAWLSSTDPVVAAALGEDGGLRDALAAARPDPAGQLV